MGAIIFDLVVKGLDHESFLDFYMGIQGGLGQEFNRKCSLAGICCHNINGDEGVFSVSIDPGLLERSELKRLFHYVAGESQKRNPQARVMMSSHASPAAFVRERVEKAEREFFVFSDFLKL